MKVRNTFAGFLAALFSTIAGGAIAEPTLDEILGSGYVEIAGSVDMSDMGFTFEQINGVAVLSAEHTLHASEQTFGFYSGSESRQIFAGSDEPGSTSSLDFLAGWNGFGLYFTSENGVRYNFGSSHIRTYFNESASTYAFAFEDAKDNDYQDMVVTVARIPNVSTNVVSAVPEPEGYALMLVGLACVWLASRRHARLRRHQPAS